MGDKEYKILGSFKFISKQIQIEKGFSDKHGAVIDDIPHLMYIEGDLGGNYRGIGGIRWYNPWHDNVRYSVLFDYLIEEEYTLEETKMKFPELLL